MVLWKTPPSPASTFRVSYRPTPAARFRSQWALRRSAVRTAQRVATLACLALGGFAGLNTLAAGCATEAAVSSEQLAAVINRAAAVDGFADAFLTAYLSGAGADVLANYTSVRIEPSPVPVNVVKTAVWSTQPTPSGFGNIDYWSVVIGAVIKPVGRTAQLRHFQIPVAVINGTLRAVSAPALINGPALGFDPELAYPHQLGAGNELHDTVSGFLTAWLAGGADLQRYSASPAIRPFDPAPFSRVQVSVIASDTAIPAAPAEGFTTRILVTANAQDTGLATSTLAYPLTVSFQGSKWFIADIDLTPKLGGRISPATAAPPAPPTTPPPAAWTTTPR